jgi:DNA-directed RNA polymerase subunit M/transcription elongation factor TFIIS
MSISFCETCKEFFTEHRMASETKCDKCEAQEYLRSHENERRTNEKVSPKKEQETRSVPRRGDGRLRTGALVGQLTLQI